MLTHLYRIQQKDISQRNPKRAAIDDGISAGSASSFRYSSASAPRPMLAPNGTLSVEENMSDSQRPMAAKKWIENDATVTISSMNASIQAQKARRASYKQRSPKIRTSTTTSDTLVETPASQTLFSSVDDSYDIILQPVTRPISQEQLIAEVKGTYAGLVMVEARCIEVDNEQAALAQGDPQAQPKFNNEQWQALIALHRTLLHEHHDFFLASQHPSASPALRRLASKYAMPARMWRHGIHSFLEVLRHRLPASLEHMLAFIYLAYPMMALLYETVPVFEDTWIECLGDLGRYRMAIEDDDIGDREVWTGVARNWYSQVSDKAPTTGRLYHHLAILARPNAFAQLSYYSKSLLVAVPFASARESMLTLFNPILDADSAHGQLRLPPLEISFVKAHGLLFTNEDIEKFEDSKNEFLGLLDNHIGRVTRKFMEQGYYIAIANITTLAGFAAKDNVLMQIISPRKDGGDVAMVSEQSMTAFKLALDFHNATLRVILQRIGDPNVLPFVHVAMVLIHYLTQRNAMALLEPSFPWEDLITMLNLLLMDIKSRKSFPPPQNAEVLYEALLQMDTTPAIGREDRIYQSFEHLEDAVGQDRLYDPLPKILANIGSDICPPTRRITMLSHILRMEHVLPEMLAAIESKDFTSQEREALCEAIQGGGLLPLRDDPKDRLLRIESKEFPRPPRIALRPFPEDFAMRGLMWVDGYYPETWFPNKIDQEEKHLEVADMTDDRKERILWLAHKIAQTRWITYDGTSFKTSIGMEAESIYHA